MAAARDRAPERHKNSTGKHLKIQSIFFDRPWRYGLESLLGDTVGCQAQLTKLGQTSFRAIHLEQMHAPDCGGTILVNT